MDTFSEDDKYEKHQDNDLHFDTKLDLPLDDCWNPLPQHLSEMADDLFGELSNLDLLDFLHTQDLSNIESIQKLDTTQSRLLPQSADIEQPIFRESRNIWEYVSICNHNSSTPAFHNIGMKIEAKFGFAPFS